MQPTCLLKKIISVFPDFFCRFHDFLLDFYMDSNTKSRKSRIFCYKSLPVVINHKSPFRKAGTGLSMIWQGKAIRTEGDCDYSGVAFYIVTKIVAVKIRFGFSQPLLQAVSIVNTNRTIPVVHDFFVSGNESRYSRPTLAYLAGASELYIIIEDILCLQSERPAESIGRPLYEKSSLQAEQNHTYDRQHNPDPLRHRHFFPEQESRQNDREEQDTTVFDSIQHRNVHQ